MNEKKHKSKIGGQALIEGVMMRGLDKISMAVRCADGHIDIETWSAPNMVNPPLHRKIPVIRGVFNFAESMIVGYKCLMKSAEKSEFGEGIDDVAEKSNKSEEMETDNKNCQTAGTKENEDKSDSKIMKVIAVTGLVLGMVIAVVLFMFFPVVIVKGINSLIELGNFKTVVEGIVKITIFVCYLALMSLMKDIRRTFEYHGAEHKSISCYEAGEELTVENVRKFSRFHPRCGTSFMIITLVLSILVFSVLPWGNSAWTRVGFKFLLLPLVVGMGYELIKLAGRYTNAFTKIISAPGIFLQNLTTKEPDDSQIEIAVAALNEVIPANKDDDKW